MISVTAAYYIEQYKIHVTFNNHESGIIDLQEAMTQDRRQIFNQLVDIDQFKRFSIKADTIVWENGLDLAPEFLYEKLKKLELP